MYRIWISCFTLFACYCTSFTQAQEQNRTISTEKSLSHEAEILSHVIYAVHATRIFPSDGIIVAGLGGKNEIMTQSGLSPELFPDFRCTVHFSLGEMVRPVEGVINWEDCPYAIVTPLYDLLPQLINLNCYDTFILGDYHLNSSATVVLPITIRDSLPNAVLYNYYFYDPTQSSLRQAVDEVIAMHGGWPIRMTEEDREDELKEAFLEDVNINTADFFQPLQESNACICIGCRFDPWDGEAYRFGRIENRLYMIASQFLNPVAIDADHLFTTNELTEWRIFLTEDLKELETYVNSLPMPQGTLKILNDKTPDLISWLNIIDADIKLRTFYQKTIVNASPDIWAQIHFLRYYRNDLDVFLEEHLFEFQDYAEALLITN